MPHATSTAGTVNYTIDPNAGFGSVIEDRDQSGNLLERYDLAGGDLLDMQRTGGTSWYLFDGHGSTMQLTDGTGAVTDTYEYDAYGDLLSRTGTTPNNYLYDAQCEDPDGLYYLRARYMDPARGEFLGQDPYGGTDGDPVSLHRYLYCADDPEDREDPGGRDGDLVGTLGAMSGIAIIAAEEEPAVVGALVDAEGVAGEVAVLASGDAQNLLQEVSDVLVKRWNPFNGPGPLGNLPNYRQVISSFRGGSYSEVVTTSETTLYRAYGGAASEIGQYWTRMQPLGPLQTASDSAILPEWGNTVENIATIRVPAGTTLYEGYAAAQQGSVWLPGGGSQVVIPNVDPSWLVK